MLAVSKLSTKHKHWEAKQKLANSYKVFVADKYVNCCCIIMCARAVVCVCGGGGVVVCGVV